MRLDELSYPEIPYVEENADYFSEAWEILTENKKKLWDDIHKPMSGDKKGYKKGWMAGFQAAIDFLKDDK